MLVVVGCCSLRRSDGCSGMVRNGSSSSRCVCRRSSSIV